METVVLPCRVCSLRDEVDEQRKWVLAERSLRSDLEARLTSEQAYSARMIRCNDRLRLEHKELIDQIRTQQTAMRAYNKELQEALRLCEKK